MFCVKALVAYSALFPGNLGRAVRAVVRRHKNSHQVGGVVLGADAVDEVAQHRLLVPGRHQDGIFVVALGRGKAAGEEDAGDLIDFPVFIDPGKGGLDPGEQMENAL